MGELVKIGVAWKNRNDQGKAFLSGKLGEATLLVLPNREKTEGGKEPDYCVFVSTPKPKTQAPSTQAPPASDDL